MNHCYNYTMTNQEIFDKVVRHLLTQKAQSTDGSNCLYRGEHGMSCAVGCLISDEHYTPDIESRDVSYCLVVDVLEKSGIGVRANDACLNMLHSLQSFHDSRKYKLYRKYPHAAHLALKYIARLYKLDPSVILEFDKGFHLKTPYPKNLKVGDLVQVFRKLECGAYNYKHFNNTWELDMDKYVNDGTLYRIEQIGPSGVFIGNTFFFPPSCLKKVRISK